MPRKKKAKKAKKSGATSDPFAQFDDEVWASLAKECHVTRTSRMKRSTVINNLKPYYRSEQQLIAALNAHREPNNIELQKKKPNPQYMHSFDRRPHQFQSMKVYEYSQMKLQKIKEKYASEMNKREIAKSKITPPQPLNDQQINNSQTRKQYLWSHLMPTFIFKMIFLQCIDSNGDKSVLSLIKVCKKWRNILNQNENDEMYAFHSHVWHGCVSHLGSPSHRFDWRYLGAVPDEYLKIITNIPLFQEMSIEEIKMYRDLSKCDNTRWQRCHDRRCSAAYDPESEDIFVGNDSNIPLIIATLSKCPNISSLTLMGWLCKDIFFALATSCVALNELEFVCTEHGKEEWLDILIRPRFAPMMLTVQNVSINRSFWVGTSVMFVISKFVNMVSFSAEKLNLSGFALAYLFGSDRKLEYIEFDRCFYSDDSPEEWEEAFRVLARWNKVIRMVSFNGCDAFDDACLKRLMGKNACPTLQELCLNYHSCSGKMIAKYKKAKPNVEFSDHL